ncbi:hypothetical protein QQF64_035054 [Cirrhinus molitorella]|uniref:Uncharacterized protein n=1 Tax=Cirrhinus molitorella TaxID=172907 RepID=A0ABR3NF29_9TELE
MDSRFHTFIRASRLLNITLPRDEMVLQIHRSPLQFLRFDFYVTMEANVCRFTANEDGFDGFKRVPKEIGDVREYFMKPFWI